MSQKVTFDLDEEAIKKLAQIAYEQGTNRSIVLRQIIYKALGITRKASKKEQTNVQP